MCWSGRADSIDVHVREPIRKRLVKIKIAIATFAGNGLIKWRRELKKRGS